ncbi:MULTISPECIES: hypothetical protein [unclassified Rhizobium]|nr:MULTISPECIES: hypothetical protein [unclassified Rhizobium]
MNSTEKANIARRLLDLKRLGITMLIVEHDMKSVMSVCDNICVINFGTKIGEGTPREITANQAVIEAYLGPGGGVHA